MRIHKIDLLRAIGLFMIIAAHLSPPAILHQLRNFDVPLMVLISGAAFQASHRSGGGGYPAYVWKRFKRLIVPVWIFLTLQFMLFAHVSPGHSILDAESVQGSYLLSDRVDYLWIIRVFFLVALVAPLLYRLNQKIQSDRVFFLLLLSGMGSYHLLRYSEAEYALGLNFAQLTQSSLYYLLPYGMVFLLGMRLIRLRKPVQQRLFYFFLLSFAVMGLTLAGLTGSWVPTQAYKYPVAYYYLSYAMTVSIALWITGRRLWRFLDDRIKDYIRFVSEHSIWMYLWHIPLIRCAGYVDLPFAVEFPLTVLVASAITAIHLRLVHAFILSWVTSKDAVKNVRLMLMG